MKSQFNDLNQFKAITHGDGPACILAGPGSGKTYVITNRIHHLISSGVSPSKILVITFTKAAANEMKARFSKLDNHSEGVVFGTFHSVYLSILRYYSNMSETGIISGYRQKQLIAKILENNSLYRSNLYFSVDQSDDLISAISFYKSGKNKIPGNFPKDLFLLFIKEYEECLQAASLIDFDDILIKTNNFLQNNTDKQKMLKERFSYILVDEFQDINELQYDILRMIVNDSHNIFIVGDDDQSIYGFRGASPGIMARFIKDYPDTVKIELTNNYRSTENIITAAQKVISHNLFRLKISSGICNRQNEGLFSVRLFNDSLEELDYIKRIIFEESEPSKNICILVRTNRDINRIRDYLDKNIYSESNFEMQKCRRKLYEIVRAYISFCFNRDYESILKIIKCPNRYLSREIFVSGKIDLDSMVKKYSGTYKGHQLEVLRKTIRFLEKSSPFAFITYLFNYCGIHDWFIENFGKEHEKEFVILKNELITKARDYMNLNTFYENIISCEVKQFKIKDDLNENHKKYEIMTFHASKGLEFDTVIIPDVNEGKIPGRASLVTGDSDEERRLFYVAMTRAKDKLYITAVKGRDSIRMLPSRFITEFLE